MIKSAEELKKQAQKIKLTFYPVHECSICGYQCGYKIRGNDVYYDAGCYCIMKDLEARTWEELANTYNMNQPENNPKISKEFLEKLQVTWRF